MAGSVNASAKSCIKLLSLAHTSADSYLPCCAAELASNTWADRSVCCTGSDDLIKFDKATAPSASGCSSQECEALMLKN